MRLRSAVFSFVALLGLLPAPFALAQNNVATAPTQISPAEKGIVSLPLERNYNHLIVSVLVNGKPARLVIDTGASVHCLSPDAAVRLGVASGKAVTAKGAANTAATLSTIETLQLGDASMRKAPVAIVDFPAELEADGVLGVPLFTEYIVTLDYTGKRLTLTPRDRKISLPDAMVLPLRQESDNLFSTSGSLFGFAGLYEVDTGNADALILFAPFVRKNRLEERFTTRFRTITGIGVGGYMYGQSARLPLFLLGEKENVVGIIAPVIEMHNGAAGGFLSETLAGNIGAGIWSRFTVTFDVKRKKLYLQKNADFGKSFPFNRNGIVARFVDGAMEVLDILPGSPAEEAGFAIGDRVLSVNDVAVEPGYNTPARNALRDSPVGTAFKIVYRRKGENVDRTATIITRDLL